MFWTMWSTTSFDSPFNVDTTSFIFYLRDTLRKKSTPPPPPPPASATPRPRRPCACRRRPAHPLPQMRLMQAMQQISALGPGRKHGGTHPPLPTQRTDCGRGDSQPRRWSALGLGQATAASAQGRRRHSNPSNVGPFFHLTRSEGETCGPLSGKTILGAPYLDQRYGLSDIGPQIPRGGWDDRVNVAG